MANYAHRDLTEKLVSLIFQ